MTSVVRQRWATRQLVGDKQHVQIVRLRPGFMDRGYMDDRRIDDGSTPFNGSPIFPPLIWKGHNHTCWQSAWTPTGPWVTLPNVQSSKWQRDFDIQTGATKGTSQLTVVMDNIAFLDETGAAGLYHAIARGYFSPTRGYRAPGRVNWWPNDTPNAWQNVLDGGYQIELWEGYGAGTDVELKATLDPTTNSYAPDSGALDRTWTGIVVDCDSESHPDQITIAASDFGVYLTDQRVLGDNKAPECRSPITFADRLATQGENKIAGPYSVSSGTISEDGTWLTGEDPGTYWIELPLPAGHYEDFFTAPVFPGPTMYVSLFLGAAGGTMDRVISLPAGWVTGLTGGGTTPDGTPYMFKVDSIDDTPRRWYLGHGFDVTDGSKLRLTFHTFGALYHFYAYQFGSNPTDPPGAQVNAKGWILVDDAAEVARMVFVWAGFKEWNVEDFEWSLWKPMVFGEDKFFIDIITDLLQQGSFIFYMGPPSNDDRSLGKPHFEHIHAIDPPSTVLEVRDSDMVEALDIKTDLSSLPWVMRYRGVINKKTGQTFGQDLTKRVMATYYPPWTGRYQPVAPDTLISGTQIRRIAGIRRHFTETMSLTLVVALTTPEECLFACVLAAIQYGLNMKQATCQIPGLSRMKLNDQVSVVEEASATNSRMWLTSVTSEHVNGGSDQQGHWTMTLGGSLIDTPEMASIIEDYHASRQMALRSRAGW